MSTPHHFPKPRFSTLPRFIQTQTKSNPRSRKPPFTPPENPLPNPKPKPLYLHPTAISILTFTHQTFPNPASRFFPKIAQHHPKNPIRRASASQRITKPKKVTAKTNNLLGNANRFRAIRKIAQELSMLHFYRRQIRQI